MPQSIPRSTVGVIRPCDHDWLWRMTEPSHAAVVEFLLS